MDDTKTIHPSLPANYITIVDLQKQWMKQQQLKNQQEEEQKQRREESNHNLSNKGDEINSTKRNSQFRQINSSRNPNLDNRKIVYSGRFRVEKPLKEVQVTTRVSYRRTQVLEKLNGDSAKLGIGGREELKIDRLNSDGNPNFTAGRLKFNSVKPWKMRNAIPEASEIDDVAAKVEIDGCVKQQINSDELLKKESELRKFDRPKSDGNPKFRSGRSNCNSMKSVKMKSTTSEASEIGDDAAGMRIDNHDKQLNRDEFVKKKSENQKIDRLKPNRNPKFASKISLEKFSVSEASKLMGNPIPEASEYNVVTEVEIGDAEVDNKKKWSKKKKNKKLSKREGKRPMDDRVAEEKPELGLDDKATKEKPEAELDDQAAGEKGEVGLDDQTAKIEGKLKGVIVSGKELKNGRSTAGKPVIEEYRRVCGSYSRIERRKWGMQKWKGKTTENPAKDDVGCAVETENHSKGGIVNVVGQTSGCWKSEKNGVVNVVEAENQGDGVNVVDQITGCGKWEVKMNEIQVRNGVVSEVETGNQGEGECVVLCGCGQWEVKMKVMPARHGVTGEVDIENQGDTVNVVDQLSGCGKWEAKMEKKPVRNAVVSAVETENQGEGMNVVDQISCYGKGRKPRAPILGQRQVYHGYSEFSFRNGDIQGEGVNVVGGISCYRKGWISRAPIREPGKVYLCNSRVDRRRMGGRRTVGSGLVWVKKSE